MEGIQHEDNTRAAGEMCTNSPQNFCSTAWIGHVMSQNAFSLAKVLEIQSIFTGPYCLAVLYYFCCAAASDVMRHHSVTCHPSVMPP